jgi:hypothetical protein
MQFFRSHWRNIIIFLATTALFAYLLQTIARETFLQPLSYLWQQVNLLYRSVAQIVYWAFLLVMVLGIAASSLLVRLPNKEQNKRKERIERGPVEEMAWWISNSQSRKRSTYFKWYVAHRIAEAALRVNTRETLPRWLPTGQLLGEDKSMPPDVRNYLAAGLEHQSAANEQRLYFGPGPHIRLPYGVDMEKVIAYLETRMESNRDGKSG